MSNIEKDYNQCFTGNNLKDECNKKSFLRKIGLILLKDVTGKDTTLLEWRCDVKISGSDLNKEICYHQEKTHLSQYESLQKYCYNRYNTHGVQFVTSKQKILGKFNMKKETLLKL